MLQASTPFSIHDENGPQTAKLGGKTGLGGGGPKRVGLVDSTPLKAGTLANGAKSTRKALGDLSSSQVNTRLATPQHGGGGGAATTTKKIQFPTVGAMGLGSSMKHKISTQAAPQAVAESSRLVIARDEEYDVADMLCSRIGKEEDVFDAVMRKAAKIKYTLSPPMATVFPDYSELDECCWQEQPVEGDLSIMGPGLSVDDEPQAPVLDCELPEDDKDEDEDHVDGGVAEEKPEL